MYHLLQNKVQQLGDLELAILVSLVSQEHCLFSCVPNSTTDLREELRLICSDAFGLQPAIIDCSRKTTVDEFSEAVLVETTDAYEELVESRLRGPANHVFPSGAYSSERGQSPRRFGSVDDQLDDRRIADVVIATNLDRADTTVQVQALELLRTKRIFTRTAMHSAPKDLLFITILSEPKARLSHHLQDMFAMSHFHAEEDGLPFLESRLEPDYITSNFLPDEINELRTLTRAVHVGAEVAAYLHNLVVFARLSRYISGGVTATATRNLRTVAMALAPLHGVDFVTPSLIALAVRKVYPHRLVLATAETERSLQWGSDPEAVRNMLEGMTVEDAIEELLASVGTPL